MVSLEVWLAPQVCCVKRPPVDRCHQTAISKPSMHACSIGIPDGPYLTCTVVDLSVYRCRPRHGNLFTSLIGVNYATRKPACISPPSPEAASRRVQGRVARELKSRAGQPAAPAPGLSYLDLACFTHYRHPTSPRHRDTRDAPGGPASRLTPGPRRCARWAHNIDRGAYRITHYQRHAFNVSHDSDLMTHSDSPSPTHHADPTHRPCATHSTIHPGPPQIAYNTPLLTTEQNEMRCDGRPYTRSVPGIEVSRESPVHESRSGPHRSR
jgi:hypothetical protein